MPDKPVHPSTKCVELPPHCDGSIQPIDPSTAYAYIDSGPQAYPRYFNTANQICVAQKIADLEGAEAGLVFSSGMAAISTTINALTQPGDHAIFLTGIYGGSQSFIASELDDRNVAFDYVEKSTTAFAAAIRDNTSLIYIESPTNPVLDIVDITAIAQLAREREIVTVIDNTFASPINQNPIELGIDVVVHSGTKYLGGHSDLCCGAAVASKSLMDRIYKKAKIYGGSLNGLTVYLLDRSLKTLEIRVRQQTENAMQLAQFLESLNEVNTVWYPGLESHPEHSVATSQMKQFGAMIAFELAAEIPVNRFFASVTSHPPGAQPRRRRK